MSNKKLIHQHFVFEVESSKFYRNVFMKNDESNQLKAKLDQLLTCKKIAAWSIKRIVEKFYVILVYNAFNIKICFYFSFGWPNVSNRRNNKFIIKFRQSKLISNHVWERFHSRTLSWDKNDFYYKYLRCLSFHNSNSYWNEPTQFICSSLNHCALNFLYLNLFHQLEQSHRLQIDRLW